MTPHGSSASQRDTSKAASPDRARDLIPETVAEDDATPPKKRSIEGGEHIGRYVVLYRVGRGGMGVVYAGYDPELDRKVAIKLLKHRKRRGGSNTSSGAGRLLREAQALARLSHPNVVAIHDVGVLDGRVFVAMEFVEGATLRKWRFAETRTWRQVVEVFVQAGRGLAAAHAAGLVHRDFKPDNVIVTPQGKAQVLDFGLARARGAAPEPGGSNSPGASSAVASDSKDGGDLGSPITRAGAVLGTPAYMAPEQHLGLPADAQADQFSYCVSLYETLFGEPPFWGEDADAFREAVTTGTVREPPRGVKIPGWLRRALLRGLAPQPRHRYPDMNALLAALTPKRNTPRRAVGAAAGIVVVAGATALVLRGDPNPCDDTSSELDDVWSDDDKRAIEDAFAATKRPFATAAWHNTRAILDARAQAWADMRRQNCEATWVEHAQTDEIMSLRIGCLQRRLDEFRALTSLLAEADDKIVERSVQAAHALPAIEGCADIEALTADVPTPEDPTDRIAVSDIRVRLTEARARMQAGKYDEGVALARAALGHAREIAFRPVEAEALITLGELQQLQGDHKGAYRNLKEAVFAAEAGGHPRAEAEAWSELVSVASTDPDLSDSAGSMERHAHAILEHLDHDPPLEAKLFSASASLRTAQGKYSEAVELHERALEIRQRLHGIEHPDVSASFNGLGNAYIGVGEFATGLKFHEQALELNERIFGPQHPDVAVALTGMAIACDELGFYDRSRPAYTRAASIFEGAFGPDHPQVATAANNLAGVLFAQGKYDSAYQQFSRALGIWEQVYGKDHVHVALPLGNIGLALEGMGRYDEALEAHQRSLELRERSLGPDHPDVAVSLNNLGDLHNFLGRYQQALTTYRRSVKVLEGSLGPEHPRVAGALMGLGGAREGLRHYDRAMALYERVLRIRETALGSEHVSVADVLTRMGSVYAARGSRGPAKTRLERALRILEERGADELTRADARFELARVLWTSDPQRARGLAQQAQGAMATGGPLHADDLVAVNQWLQQHPHDEAAVIGSRGG